MIYVIGQIFKDKELAGYRLLDVAGRDTADMPLDKIRDACSRGLTFENAYYKPEAGILIGTQGSLTNYQSIYTNGVLFGRKKLTICYKILDSTTNTLGGYGICDGYGMLINVKLDKFLSLCSKYNPSNFELVSNSKGVPEVKSLGVDFQSIKMQMVTAKKGYNSKLGEKDDNVCAEVKDSNQSNMLPTIKVYSYSDIKDNEFALSSQEKLFKAYNNMKRLSPYYHTILMSIKREATFAVSTMAVTEDTMYYSPKFVSELEISEITFILIHEVCHIAMRHSVRHGKRDNELWNIATDLYINSIISRDFDCHYGGKEMEATTPLGKAVIKVPSLGIHLSTIGETLDFGVDTPETIYDRLVKENSPKQNSQQQNSGMGSPQQGSSSQQQGSSSQQQGGDSQQDDVFSQNRSKSLDGNDISSDRSSLAEDGTEVDQKDIYEKTQKVSVVYNGKKLEGAISMDVMTSEIGDSAERNQNVEEKSLITIQGMKTAVEMKEEKIGEKLVKNAGSGCGLVQRCIDFGLSTRVNWRVLLRNMCKSKPKKVYTMGNPNEVYMNAGVTVASRRKIGKPTTIEGIKVCIDVSGSVSKKELDYYLSEINSILMKYDVEGELIYWSTMIGDAGKFSELKDLLRVKPVTSGGTDVKCVFDYLARKTRVNSKYEETPIKDISCILIFTDGCFSNNYADYARYFGKKVIWVIPDSRFMFNPPFGKIACMD